MLFHWMCLLILFYWVNLMCFAYHLNFLLSFVPLVSFCTYCFIFFQTNVKGLITWKISALGWNFDDISGLKFLFHDIAEINCFFIFVLHDKIFSPGLSLPQGWNFQPSFRRRSWNFSLGLKIICAGAWVLFHKKHGFRN